MPFHFPLSRFPFLRKTTWVCLICVHLCASVVPNNRPRPEAVVLGRPLRRGHAREEGPVGAVKVNRNSIHAGPGCYHAAPHIAADLLLVQPSRIHTIFVSLKVQPVRRESLHKKLRPFTTDRSEPLWVHGQRPWFYEIIRSDSALRPQRNVVTMRAVSAMPNRCCVSDTFAPPARYAPNTGMIVIMRIPPGQPD